MGVLAGAHSEMGEQVRQLCHLCVADGQRPAMFRAALLGLVLGGGKEAHRCSPSRVKVGVPHHVLRHLVAMGCRVCTGRLFAIELIASYAC